MKICLIGEYTYKQWCGSATHKVQKNILKELSRFNQVVLYELPCRSSRYKKLVSAVKAQNTSDGIILSGGVINFSWMLFTGKFEIKHMIVTRRYMLFLIPALVLSPGKIVISIHDTILFQSGKLNAEYCLKRLLILISHLVFVYSDFDFNLIARIKSKNKIKKIKNGVDLQLYKPAKKDSKKRIITFAGGLDNPVKGLDTLEKAVTLISKDFTLAICGENKLKAGHPAYTGELDETQFTDLLAESFIVVIPSTYESFSITALEAMAMGVPIIITGSTGIAAYLTDRINCLKIQPGDAVSLAANIKLLFCNYNLYSLIRSNGLEIVKKFTWRNSANQYRAFYGKC